ncbi:CoA transferase subunit A [Rhodococcus sp. 06-1460-1B]|uniref:CoA transferase subunit A n=1 Tax=Rhodococcus sp. 06-1460-1B TaxID=2022501 RepID=UPI000B9B19D0|nr:CoA-transferase [Rhodococcus sp. 06-1460-1B]OZD65492.1 3-oxoadipate--succinyl-CoA transferase subunit A [Rhodococcus sp. 06-1460-1B]
MTTVDRSKVASLEDAIAEHVHSGDVVSIEGFTHAIPVAAGHEMIRQGLTDLTLVRMTADIIADQLVAAGCISTLVSSFIGNSSAGSLGELRRRIERADPAPLEFVEYTHHSMVCRYLAGAQRLPFYPLRSITGSDLPSVNPDYRQVESPFPGPDGTRDKIYVVPPINPDVTIIHAQRSDRLGNIQMWGLTGIQAEAAFAADRVIVTVEEIVDDDIVRGDPNRTILPSHAIDAVVPVPMGAHPSFAQGYYDRDNAFYLEWAHISADHERLIAWLQEWVVETQNHLGYLDKLGFARIDGLAVGRAESTPIDYGRRIPL